MIKRGLWIQVFICVCCLSLKSQSFLSRIRVFPDLLFNHASPILSQDGNTVYFSMKNHLINVGIDKKSDVWVSEKTDNNGQWLKPYPLTGDINTDEEEFPMAVLNQSNCLLIRRGIEEINYSIYDFNGRIWLQNEIFEYPKSEVPFQWLSFNPLKTVCFLGFGDSTNYSIHISVLDSTSNWTKPVALKGFEKFRNINDLTVSLDNRTIYFSAESDSSYGGLDIYTAKRVEDHWYSWSQPENIGLQANSLLDEYHPSVSADGKKIFFTVKDKDDNEAIYQAVLPNAFQSDRVIGIKTNGQIFAKNRQIEGFTHYYAGNINRNTLVPLNNDRLYYGLTTYLPLSDYLLIVSDKSSFFIPSIQLPVKEGKNIYAANLQRNTYLEEFEMEVVRLEKQLNSQNNLITEIQKEINNLLKEIENSKSEIWSNINKLPDIDLKPIENELKILANSYSLTLKLATPQEADVEISFSDGANRIQFWRSEYGVINAKSEEEDTMQNFQSFVNEIIGYQWFANQLEVVRELEKEYEKEALDRLKNLITVDELALSNILMEDYIRKLKTIRQPSVFQSSLSEESNRDNLVWPVKNQLQLPFFNEISLRLKPLIEREIGKRIKVSMIDLLSQKYYLQFLREKKQLLQLDRKETTTKIETIEVRNRSKNVTLLKDSLLFESVKVTMDTNINMVAYPFDYAELIPLYVPFFPIESVNPDNFGMFELNRILQILSEYPGLGIEMAIQTMGNHYKEGRELGEKRIGFINTFFEMAGIGSDRRNIYLLENSDMRTNNNLPIQVLIRFFYRS